MKKFLNLLFFIILSLGGQVLYAMDLSDCNEIHKNELVYGDGHTLFLKMKSQNLALGIAEISHEYEASGDFNGEEPFPEYGYPDDFKNNDYVIFPNESTKVYEMNKPYLVNYHPKKSSYNNLILKYIVQYKERKNGKWGETKTFISCEKNKVIF